MSLSSRITFMYSRSLSVVAEFEDHFDDSPNHRKIRFLPGLTLPDEGPIHKPSIASSCPIIRSILKYSEERDSYTLTSKRCLTPSLPSAPLTSNDRFLQDLQSSKILATRRLKAISKLQAHVRGVIQRHLHSQQVHEAERQRHLDCEKVQTTDAAATRIQNRFRQWHAQNQVQIMRLEQQLAAIECQRQVELKQVEHWKAQEMRRARRQVGRAMEEYGRLQAHVMSNQECVQELRAQRERLLSEHETLRQGLTELRKEQRGLSVESARLQEQTKSVQQYLEDETNTCAAWTKVSMQYEEHLAQYQSMIEERDSRTVMEEAQKKLYGRAMLNIVRRVGNHEDVAEDQELTLIVRSADARHCTPLYIA